MGVQTVRGSLQPFLQRATYDFNPNTGWVSHFDFKGLSEALMIAEQQYYVGKNIACRLTYEKGIATLDVEDSSQQFTLDTWQILGNEELRDGLSHPTLWNLISDDSIATLRKYLDENKKPSDLDAPLTAAGFSGSDRAIIKRFYSLQQRGSTEYRRSQYVLRHTTNASNSWSQNNADFGIDRIYTPAQLLTEVQDSSLWIYPLPGRLVYKIGAIPTPVAQSNYQWGWVKYGSTETTAANGRIEITTEYCLEQWSTDYNFPY